MGTFQEWMNKRYGGTPTEDVSFDLTQHDKSRHGGHFDPATMTCKLRDEMKRLDEEDIKDPNAVEKVLEKADQEEMYKLEQGDDPESGNFTGVEIGDLATFTPGSTSSKYRQMRNAVFTDITRRQASGEEGLDGSYSFGPPPHKVTHTGEDGEQHDGYADGFQVSFQTTNGEGFNKEREDLQMSDEEYDRTVDELASLTGSEPVVGIFGGIPEISFRCDTLEQAMELAKKYNQVSIADNARICADIWDAMTFPKNPMYDWTRNQTYKTK